MRDEWEERNFSSDTDIVVRREYKNVAASLGGKKKNHKLYLAAIRWLVAALSKGISTQIHSRIQRKYTSISFIKYISVRLVISQIADKKSR